MTTAVDGVRELLNRLAKLKDAGGRRVLKSAIRAGLNEIGKQAKRTVSPQVKTGRKAIRGRLKGTKFIRAKVGFHVGKDRSKYPEQQKRSGKSGVGIGPNNIHWWVAGTKQRRTKKTGQNRGQMPAMQPGLMSQAALMATGAAFAAMRKKAQIQLQKELAKLKKI
jgi:hypothetical protein